MAKRRVFPSDVGVRLRAVREALSVITRELAAEAGICPAAVSHIESGATRDPCVGTVARLAKALEVEAAWLAYGVGERERAA